MIRAEMTHEDTKNTKGPKDEQEPGRGDRFHSEAAKEKARLISHEVIGAAIEVHSQLGPGLLESVYRVCLARELRLRGIECRTEVSFQASYRGRLLDMCHRLDLLVDDLVIVEVKSMERLERVHHLQLLTYLRLTERWLGLLMNFNSERIQYGLSRKLNG